MSADIFRQSGGGGGGGGSSRRKKLRHFLVPLRWLRVPFRSLAGRFGFEGGGGVLRGPKNQAVRGL